MERVYNFSAGPSMMPETVLKRAADEMLNCNGSGMSVMEMSHRSKAFEEIINGAEATLRELLNIPDNAVCHDPAQPDEEKENRYMRNRSMG